MKYRKKSNWFVSLLLLLCLFVCCGLFEQVGVSPTMQCVCVGIHKGAVLQPLFFPILKRKLIILLSYLLVQLSDLFFFDFNLISIFFIFNLLLITSHFHLLKLLLCCLVNSFCLMEWFAQASVILNLKIKFLVQTTPFHLKMLHLLRQRRDPQIQRCLLFVLLKDSLLMFCIHLLNFLVQICNLLLWVFYVCLEFTF